MRVPTQQRLLMEAVCSRAQRTLAFLWPSAQVELRQDEFREDWEWFLRTEHHGKQYRSYGTIPMHALEYGSDRFYEYLMDMIPRTHVLQLLDAAKREAARGVFG